MMIVEEEEIRNFVNFILSVERKSEIPKEKLSEKLFINLPSDEYEKIAIYYNLIDENKLFFVKASRIKWKEITEDEIIDKLGTYIRYHGEKYVVTSIIDRIEADHFLAALKIIEKEDELLKDKETLSSILESLVKRTSGSRIHALDLAIYLIGNGAFLKTVSFCHVCKLSNNDIKEIAVKHLDKVDPVLIFILNLPDEENPKYWDEWW